MRKLPSENSKKISRLLSHYATMTKGKKTFVPITSNGVLTIYTLLHKNGLVAFPYTADAEHKVEALVANITQRYFDSEIYISVEEKAVAYLYFLIKNHPFTDGNKRTAVLTFEVVCTINNLQLRTDETGLDELALFIEQTKTSEHQSFIRRLSELLFIK